MASFAQKIWKSMGCRCTLSLAIGIGVAALIAFQMVGVVWQESTDSGTSRQQAENMLVPFTEDENSLRRLAADMTRDGAAERLAVIETAAGGDDVYGPVRP